MGKNFRILCFYNDNVVQEISNKKVKGEIGMFFVMHYATLLQTFFLHHFLKMMSNFVENDGYASFTKILCFASKSFKIVESTPRIDLLFSDNQHFAFWKTVFSELDFKGFTVCVVYRTPKSRRKIQDSEKSVDMVLTKMELRVCESIL